MKYYWIAGLNAGRNIAPQLMLLGGELRPISSWHSFFIQEALEHPTENLGGRFPVSSHRLRAGVAVSVVRPGSQTHEGRQSVAEREEVSP